MTRTGTLEAEYQNSIGQITTVPLLISYTKFAKRPGNGLKVSISKVNTIKEDPQHVIVVHCNSGKGRTGTAICAILLYAGFYDNLDDCIRFYGHQRFTCGKGVSQPCQLRYLYYFEAFYRRQIKSPAVKRLRGIQFDKIPTVSGDAVFPFFEVYHCRGLETELIFTYHPTRWYLKKELTATFMLNAKQRKGWTLHGDIKILFRHRGFSDSTFCRIMFNTAFI